jgi:hypothetical protein
MQCSFTGVAGASHLILQCSSHLQSRAHTSAHSHSADGAHSACYAALHTVARARGRRGGGRGGGNVMRCTRTSLRTHARVRRPACTLDLPRPGYVTGAALLTPFHTRAVPASPPSDVLTPIRSRHSFSTAIRREQLEQSLR